MKKEDYPWNEKESNMTEKEWNEQRDWVFSFIGTNYKKRVLIKKSNPIAKEVRTPKFKPSNCV